MRKKFLLVAVAAICALGADGVAVAADSTTVVTARATVQTNASAVLAALKKNGYNLQELILYMKQHPEIFPPNVDPNTKRLVTNAVPNTTTLRQVTPVKTATLSPQVATPVVATVGAVHESGADIVARLKANGYNANELAFYKAQHPEQFPSLTTKPNVTATSGSFPSTGLVTSAQLRARGFNDAEIRTYYATH